MAIRRFCLFFIFFLFSCTSSTQKDSDQIIVALSQRPYTLDPRHATDAIGMRLSHLLFQSLVRVDRDLKVQPSLASRWSLSGTQYTFFVPKDVYFSNGRKLTKEDIEFSFAQYRLTKTPFSSAFKIIKKVQVDEKDHEFEIRIQLNHYSASFLVSDLSVLKILPKKEILLDEEGFRKKPIGTGAFMLVYQDDNQIQLKQREGDKKLVVFQVIRDDLTRYQKVLRQEIDIVQNELSYSHVHQLKAKSKTPYQFFENDGLSMNYLIFNMQDSLFKNKWAREALVLALDRKSLIQHKFLNYVSPAISILSPQNMFFASDLVPRKHQLDQARNILKKEGGESKKISLTTSNNREVVSYARLIAYQLRQLGWEVELKSYEWGTFYGDVNKGRFQVALLRWVGAFDPDIFRVAFHSEEHPPQGRNRGFYSNPVLDALLEQGKEERDLEKRKQIYYKVQHIVHKDLPIVPLWHNKQLSLVKKGLSGYFLPMNGSYDYLNQVIKKER